MWWRTDDAKWGLQAEILQVELQNSAMPLLSIDFHRGMYESAAEKGVEFESKDPGPVVPELYPVLAVIMDSSDVTAPEVSTTTPATPSVASLLRKERKENAKKRKREARETGVRPPPEDYHCAYWLAKKLRYCNLQRFNGTSLS